MFGKTITRLKHWRKWNGVSLHDLLFIRSETYSGENGMHAERIVYYNICSIEANYVTG